ncbi:formyl transferase [Riemerella columbipharyngis]|uniref:phosphoribosylglycinamide formyltransferase 1 n=1 Tax=Riemerella columbipharyngis TaxID=1071918 RepID=A0A1G7B3E0_9FLAO|nr:formyl transferase [Riemerella columbipharyngis]SDE21541.1 Formyl transferase [Riemerella columbipharyngis]
MLVGKAKSSTIMYNELKKHFYIYKVVQEEPIPMKKIMIKRMKRLGFFSVFGQILFGLMVLPVLRRLSKKQYNKVIEDLRIDLTPIDEKCIFKVDSINSKACLEFLKKENPDIVIVNGCRIISNKILSNLKSIFINTHEGITPLYRGIHGAYWALVNQDNEHCGVTVHLVDKGVDTGGIIYQGLIYPDDKDNFTTYPLYQTKKGAELLIHTIEDVFSGDLKYFQPKGESKIWYHPTIWEYFYYRIYRGVK